MWVILSQYPQNIELKRDKMRYNICTWVKITFFKIPLSTTQSSMKAKNS